MRNIYLGLGGNINDPRIYFQKAIKQLSQKIGIVSVSSLYLSAPQSTYPQPDFLNAALEVETALSPYQLLRFTQTIENQLGRKRNAEKGHPRPIDIDILLYGQMSVKCPGLIIPHPRIFGRDFVIVPLIEITDDSFFLYSQLKLELDKLRRRSNLYIKRKLKEPEWNEFIRSLVRDHRE